MAGTQPRVRGLRAADPRTLGRYEIVGRLGEGGMGSVFLAHAPDGTAVALKVIKPELADNTDFRRRFRQEVARAQEVPPFCTAEVLDADTEHDPPYLVVEYVDGPTLSDVVVQRGPLTPANQHGIALGMAIALTAIHGAGVIHRDLKPSNVLLAPGSPKVIDFGIARMAAGGQFETETDQVFGTVPYMAPERFGPDANRALTSAADVFAWGAIVAFAATGRTPFAADVPAEVAARIMTQPPDLTGLSGPLRHLVERSLAKDPADRPTARDLVESLLVGGNPLAARPTAFAEQPEVLAAAGITTAGIGDLVTVAHQKPLPPGGPRPIGPPTAAPTGATVYVQHPPRKSRGIRAAVSALTVAVLLLAGAVYAIWTGKLGNLVASHPTTSATIPSPTSLPATFSTTAPPVTPSATASSQPSVTPSSSPTPNVTSSVPPGAVSLVAGSFGNWIPTEDTVNQGSCEPGKTELTVTLTNAATRSYRCRGPIDELADFTVSVDIVNANANSCGTVWFHFSPTTGGYALMVCPDRYELISHVGSKATSVLTLFTGMKTAPGKVIHTAIRTKGDRVWFYRDDQVSAEITANQFVTGRVVLGVFLNTASADPPYKATFTNIQIWRVPTP